MANSSDDLGIPMKPARPAGPPVAPAARAPTMPPRAPDLARPGDGVRLPPELPATTRRAAGGGATQRRRGAETDRRPRDHNVRRGHLLRHADRRGQRRGEPDQLRDVEVAESGLFKGSAAIEEAGIRGRFEGNLVVRKRLMIRATGRVLGTIRYGQIEIECGGRISGDIQAQPASENPEVTASATTLAPSPAAE